MGIESAVLLSIMIPPNTFFQIGGLQLVQPDVNFPSSLMLHIFPRQFQVFALLERDAALINAHKAARYDIQGISSYSTSLLTIACEKT